MKYTKFHSALDVWHREVKDSWQVHFFSQIEADRLENLRQQFKDQGKVPPSYTAMVIQAAARAIAEVKPRYPEVNSFIRRFLFFKSIHTFDKISCGAVVSLDVDGADRIAVGVLDEPEKMTISEITEKLRGFANLESQAVKNTFIFFKMPYLLQVIVQWLAGLSSKIRLKYRGTFSITAVGIYGVDAHTLPQSSALQFGFGAVRDQVVARDGKPVVVKAFTLGLSFDRKIMNGKPPAMVVDKVRNILNSADFGSF